MIKTSIICVLAIFPATVIAQVTDEQLLSIVSSKRVIETVGQFYIDGTTRADAQFFTSPRNVKFGLILFSVAPDSVHLAVFQEKHGKWTKHQLFRDIPIAGLVKLSKIELAGLSGFLISQDFAVKYGFATFVAFDSTLESFSTIPGFERVGNAFPAPERMDLFYSYYTCGCAAACWVSRLYSFREYSLVVHAEMGCNCSESRLILNDGGTAISLEKDKCGEYSDDRLDTIQKKWQKVILSYFKP